LLNAPPYDGGIITLTYLQQKEAVHIRKEGPRSMNRDEGSYQLSHTYDRFLGSTLTRQELEEEDLVPNSLRPLVVLMNFVLVSAAEGGIALSTTLLTFHLPRKRMY